MTLNFWGGTGDPGDPQIAQIDTDIEEEIKDVEGSGHPFRGNKDQLGHSPNAHGRIDAEKNMAQGHLPSTAERMALEEQPMVLAALVMNQ